MAKEYFDTDGKGYHGQGLEYRISTSGYIDTVIAPVPKKYPVRIPKGCYEVSYRVNTDARKQIEELKALTWKLKNHRTKVENDLLDGIY